MVRVTPELAPSQVPRASGRSRQIPGLPPTLTKARHADGEPRRLASKKSPREPKHQNTTLFLAYSFAIIIDLLVDFWVLQGVVD